MQGVAPGPVLKKRQNSSLVTFKDALLSNHTLVTSSEKCASIGSVPGRQQIIQNFSLLRVLVIHHRLPHLSLFAV